MSFIASYVLNPILINVQKRRELHVWPSGATIDLTEISIPEKVMTIGIEHQDLETNQSFGILTADLTFHESF